jgi:hypothetical protein
MSDIQRWRSDHDGEMYMIPHDSPLDDSYVKTADHIADRAELVRLLKAYRTFSFQHGKCIAPNQNCLAVYRCSLCKQVDALLEGL